ncbi:WD40-repeat-containing domain protein [Lipomyces oligophaga]|uniref:WD40-repeat-containing domain protein n=1 Tax=Lipomyces oligophaga TaxID=45792 RepID=UPI0034CDFBCC
MSGDTATGIDSESDSDSKTPRSKQSQSGPSVGIYSLAPTTQTTVVSTTTTTTTTTTFPPLVINPPRKRKILNQEQCQSNVDSDSSRIQSQNQNSHTPVELLDPNIYPLAAQPTPVFLRNFQFNLGGQRSRFVETSDNIQALAILQQHVDACRSDPTRVYSPHIVSDTAQTKSQSCPTSHVNTQTISTTTTTTATLDSPSSLKKRAASPQSDSETITESESVGLGSPSTKRRMTSRLQIVGTDDVRPDVRSDVPRQLDSPDVDIVLEQPEDDDEQTDQPSESELPVSTNQDSDSVPQLTVSIPQPDTEVRIESPLSLPSPSLSPISSARNRNTDDYFSISPQAKSESEVPAQVLSEHSNMMRIPSMLDTFDSLPESVKDYVMYQFLRRCSKKSLSAIVSTVMPALRRDFLALLPHELVANILQYLDFQSLCVASQVSHTWRNAVDGAPYTWRQLLANDGINVSDKELTRAFRERWGMQGWTYANDFSGITETLLPEGGGPDVLLAGARWVRFISSERIKSYQATMTSPYQDLPLVNSAEILDRAREGPPYSNIYKSIYRRHHLIKQNWMSPTARPKRLMFPGHGRDVVTCLQFDSEKIITGSDDLCINIYDTRTGALKCRLEGHEGGVWALQYVGNTLVSGSTDRTVRVWDIKKGECTHIFYGHTSTVRCLQIMTSICTGMTSEGKQIMEPAEPIIVTGSRDSSLRVWKLPGADDEPYLPTSIPDSDGPYFLRVLHGHSQSVRAIAGHGDTIVSGSYDGTVGVWKASTGECMHHLSGHSARVYSVVIDPKRKRCISGSMDWLVKIWSIETGECLHTLEGHTSLVGLLDLSPNFLVSAAADFALRVWDPETGESIHKLEGHTGAITCFQHDDDKVISGGDGTLKLWNVKTGKLVKDLLWGLNHVWQIRFDGRLCVAAVKRGLNTYIEVLDFDYDPYDPPPDTVNDTVTYIVEE